MSYFQLFSKTINIERKDFSTKSARTIRKCVDLGVVCTHSLVCALSWWMREERKFKTILDHIVSLKEAWVV